MRETANEHPPSVLLGRFRVAPVKDDPKPGKIVLPLPESSYFGFE